MPDIISRACAARASARAASRGAQTFVTVILSLIAALLPACSARNHIGEQSPGAAGTGGAGIGSAGQSGAGGVGQAGSAGLAGRGGSAAGNTGTGGATAGTSGATGAAGATALGPQPRVLIVDPPTNRFLSFDRSGQARDYRAQLDFGAGFGARTIWLDGWFSMIWDAPPLGGNYASPGAPRGFDEPRAPSVILIRSAADSGNTVKIKAVGTSGTLLATHTLSGAWEAFQISPKRGYLYAQGHDRPPERRPMRSSG